MDQQPAAQQRAAEPRHNRSPTRYVSGSPSVAFCSGEILHTHYCDVVVLGTGCNKSGPLSVPSCQQDSILCHNLISHCAQPQPQPLQPPAQTAPVVQTAWQSAWRTAWPSLAGHRTPQAQPLPPPPRPRLPPPPQPSPQRQLPMGNCSPASLARQAAAREQRARRALQQRVRRANQRHKATSRGSRPRRCSTRNSQSGSAGTTRGGRASRDTQSSSCTTLYL